MEKPLLALKIKAVVVGKSMCKQHEKNVQNWLIIHFPLFLMRESEKGYFT